MIAISACLAGVKCRYNATSSLNKPLLKYLNNQYITICPEVLAGLTVPRLPCEIAGGSGEEVLCGRAVMIDKDKNDITRKMVFGAKEALKICIKKKVTKAYLQAKSPTCGVGKIYDGGFSSSLVQGNGVFAALLLQNGIKVVEVDTGFRLST
ncbi:MAG: DUF523 domain-containing protein [Oscillospiraceae bacterium]